MFLHGQCKSVLFSSWSEKIVYMIFHFYLHTKKNNFLIDSILNWKKYFFVLIWTKIANILYNREAVFPLKIHFSHKIITRKWQLIDQYSAIRKLWKFSFVAYYTVRITSMNTKYTNWWGLNLIERKSSRIAKSGFQYLGYVVSKSSLNKIRKRSPFEKNH